LTETELMCKGKDLRSVHPSTPPTMRTSPSDERQRIGTSGAGMNGISSQLDNYLHAKNKLQKAVAEHYR